MAKFSITADIIADDDEESRTMQLLLDHPPLVAKVGDDIVLVTDDDTFCGLIEHVTVSYTASAQTWNIRYECSNSI